MSDNEVVKVYSNSISVHIIDLVGEAPPCRTTIGALLLVIIETGNDY